jgi:TfoX/Sxy family transcriptional regulator of competence genes
MTYDEALADRVREVLATQKKKVQEKQMFSGLTFMVNGKMCVGVHTDELMVRFDPELQEKVLSKKGTREMDFTNKVMKGYVFIDKNVVKNKKDLDYWVDLALDFNDRAKASKKAKPTQTKKK